MTIKLHYHVVLFLTGVFHDSFALFKYCSVNIVSRYSLLALFKPTHLSVCKTMLHGYTLWVCYEYTTGYDIDAIAIHMNKSAN